MRQLLHPYFVFNSIEFEGIKTWVVELLPYTQKQHGVLVFEPLFDQGAAAIEVPHHAGERDVVLFMPRGDGDFSALDSDGTVFHVLFFGLTKIGADTMTVIVIATPSHRGQSPFHYLLLKLRLQLADKVIPVAQYAR